MLSMPTLQVVSWGKSFYIYFSEFLNVLFIHSFPSHGIFCSFFFFLSVFLLTHCTFYFKKSKQPLPPKKHLTKQTKKLFDHPVVQCNVKLTQVQEEVRINIKINKPTKEGWKQIPTSRNSCRSEEETVGCRKKAWNWHCRLLPHSSEGHNHVIQCYHLTLGKAAVQLILWFSPPFGLQG